MLPFASGPAAESRQPGCLASGESQGIIPRKKQAFSLGFSRLSWARSLHAFVNPSAAGGACSEYPHKLFRQVRIQGRHAPGRGLGGGEPPILLFSKSKFLIHARAVLLPPSGLTIGKNGHILKTAKHMGGDSQWATARDALRAKACRDRGRRARWRVIHNSVRPPLASLNVVTAGKAKHEEGFFACVPFPHDLRVQGSKEKGR